MLSNLLLFLLSAFFLALGGIYLVKSLGKISHFLRISEFTAAFIIMAVATSIPELFVGLSSAIQGSSSLSLGNIIGANIIDLTLIMGIFVLLGKGIKLESREAGKDAHLMSFSIALIMILYLIGNSLSRIDGIILLSFFMINTIRMLRKRKKYRAKLKQNSVKRHEIVLNSFIFIFALFVLFISASFAVKYASLLALELNLPKIIIGLFLISFATTLPELIFGIESVIMKHESMSIGNQTGTVFTNITLILGLVALISPIKVELSPFLVSVVFMFISALIFTYFMKTGKKLDVKEGIFLILLYVAFIIFEIFIQ